MAQLLLGTGVLALPYHERMQFAGKVGRTLDGAALEEMKAALAAATASVPMDVECEEARACWLNSFRRSNQMSTPESFHIQQVGANAVVSVSEFLLCIGCCGVVFTDAAHRFCRIH